MPPRKFPVRHPVIVDVGCGCRRPKLPSFITSSVPKHKPDNPATTSSSSPSSIATPSTKHNKDKRVVNDSLAIMKESSDPYTDFRDSMVQMIVEMEIYAWDDLRDLLHRFLALNAPYHHHVIVRAFAEIWNGLFAPSPATDGKLPGPRRR